MNTLANKSLHLPVWIGGIAAILVSGIAIASIAISTRGFDSGRTPVERFETAAAPAAAPARAYRCGAECGVIESTRRIEATGASSASGRSVGGPRGEFEGKPFQNQEITIRLRDGSMRVITDANPARWKHGERVTIIAGAN